jgi:hypothetical protein
MTQFRENNIKLCLFLGTSLDKKEIGHGGWSGKGKNKKYFVRTRR